MKKIITLILLITLIPYLTGCYSLKEITTDEIENGQKGKLIILSRDMVRYEFERNMYSVRADSLYGYGIRVNTDEEELPFTGKVALNDITSIHLEQIDPFAMGCLGLGIISLAIIVGIAISDFKVPVSMGRF